MIKTTLQLVNILLLFYSQDTHRSFSVPFLFISKKHFNYFTVKFQPHTVSRKTTTYRQFHFTCRSYNDATTSRAATKLMIIE